MLYDLIIIGGGPAAMSAGIYSARKKLKTLLIAKELGGQPNEAWQIENYLGFEEISGVDLAQKFIKHLKKFSADIKIKEREIVVEIKTGTTPIFEVKTKKETFETRAIIVAAGARPRKLNIPGEEKFQGRGVVYCATCDAPVFAGKTVAIAGSGNAGFSAALQLTKYAAQIYLINKYPDLKKGDAAWVEKIFQSPLIKVLNNSIIEEIKGDKFVSSIIIKNSSTGQTQEIETQGVFVEIGTSPDLHFLNELVKYNQKGEIIISAENNMSSCPGIFAAGDATNIPHKQIIIAAGEGAKAALSAYNYLQRINK